MSDYDDNIFAIEIATAPASLPSTHPGDYVEVWLFPWPPHDIKICRTVTPPVLPHLTAPHPTRSIVLAPDPEELLIWQH